MSNNTIKKLLLLIVISLLILPESLAYAKSIEFSDLNMEVKIPEETIILTKDTPTTDNTWDLIGIKDPAAEIKSMEEMGVQSIFFDPNSKTTVRLLSKETQESKNIFHLSSLADKELDDFLARLFQPQDETTVYNTKIYPQKETSFFRLYIETPVDDGHFKELVYGTIVNGTLISFHMYEYKGDKSIDDNYIQDLVDGINFTNYQNKEEYKKQQRLNTLYSMIPVTSLIIIVAIYLLISKWKRGKLAAFKERRATELSAFYKNKGNKDDISTNEKILFINKSQYSKDVFQSFFFYREVVGRIRKWIIFSVLYIAIFILMTLSETSSITYITVVLLIIAYIYFIGIRIEKLVEREMKFFNISKSTELTFSFYEEHFSISGDNKNFNYPYLQINKLVEYKNYLYIFVDIDKAVYLNKDGFKQNTDDFMRFIKQKYDTYSIQP